MKKAKGAARDEMRTEYRREDFPGGLTRGKYAARIKASSNIVVLEPEVAAAFPTDAAVNDALRSLIAIAKASTAKRRRSNGRGAKRRAA